MANWSDCHISFCGEKDKIPAIGESDGEHPCFSIDGFDVHEGAPGGPNGGWNVMVYNRKTGLFEERELVPGDFVSEEKITYLEDAEGAA